MDFTNEVLKEVIFHQNKYYKIGQPYVNLFLSIPDEQIIPVFSIQMTDFRSEYANKTGKWIKEKIIDFIA